MSISNGHVPHPVCYTKAMHENDETDFPPIPPPPPMTAEQRAQAEASILAALAREAERQARLMDTETCWDAALKDEIVQESCCMAASSPDLPAPDICGSAVPPTKREKRWVGRRRRSASLPDLDLPENKPRKPNLHAANLSFAARVIIWVRDRYANNAPAIYKAAYLSRKTYSAIISDENHVVSKRTAVQLAFALRLTREEADLLLHAAGYHLSRSVVEDMIFDACLEANIHNLEDVNHFLLAYECRPFVPQA